MTKHWGGVAANIAYSLGMLGLNPKLFGTVGRDFGDYRDHLQAVGVDCSTVRELNDVFTASFFANTDQDNNQIASFYAGAMAFAKDYTLADVYQGEPDLVVVSPNDPTAMVNLTNECRQRGIRFMADPSQQVPRLSGDELATMIKGAYLLVVNGYEAEIISNKTGLSKQQLRDQVDNLIVTRGKNGAEIYQNGDVTQIGIFDTDHILDPTGVGDAFRAGLIRGVASGWDLDLSCQVGSLCAAYTLEQVGTQNHAYTIREFVERFRTQYDDGGKLDELLA